MVGLIMSVWERGGGGACNLMDEEKAFQSTLHIALLIKRLF